MNKEIIKGQHNVVLTPLHAVRTFFIVQKVNQHCFISPPSSHGEVCDICEDKSSLRISHLLPSPEDALNHSLPKGMCMYSLLLWCGIYWETDRSVKSRSPEYQGCQPYKASYTRINNASVVSKSPYCVQRKIHADIEIVKPPVNINNVVYPVINEKYRTDLLTTPYVN